MDPLTFVLYAALATLGPVIGLCVFYLIIRNAVTAGINRSKLCASSAPPIAAKPSYKPTPKPSAEMAALHGKVKVLNG